MIDKILDEIDENTYRRWYRETYRAIDRHTLHCLWLGGVSPTKQVNEMSLSIMTAAHDRMDNATKPRVISGTFLRLVAAALGVV